MSILDKATDGTSGLRRPDPFTQDSLRVQLSERETGEYSRMGFATQEQHIIELRVQAMYWANAAQQEQAREAAKRSLVHLLYGDALKYLYRLRQAAQNGDTREVIKWSLELEDELVRS